ncbi:MAG TPA: hypothetical protein DCG47_10725 [Spirochaetaceae bacterium]|jgi:hypothetical protein|nr:hypothetical protein [Spirochaetaceae bacterium]
MNRLAKRIALVLAIALFTLGAAFAQGAQPFGSIDYVEGSASIMRGNKSLGEANIGDEVMPDDLIKTAADGIVIINLDRSTGMRGTLTIRPKSVAYLRLNKESSGVKSGIELISGQIASKMTKLAGNPSFNVSTETVAMGVRGTAFSVATSVNGSVLITCTEGEVSANDGQATVAVPAGKAVERKPSERLRLLAVAISDPEQFEKRWIADEIEAFRADAPRALADFERRYTDLKERFIAAFDPLQKSETLAKWIREDSAGLVPRANDPATLREKRELIGKIQEVRKILFIFERIYYRIDQLEGIVLGTPLERVELKKGMTAGDFLRRFRAEASALERRVATFRYAERLYALRNEGSSGLGSGTDDFFGSNDGWDF